MPSLLSLTSPCKDDILIGTNGQTDKLITLQYFAQFRETKMFSC